MTGIDEVNKAQDTMDLETILATAASERNCELDNSLTYKEQADFLREEAKKDGGDGADKMVELADILDVAETKWFDLEAGNAPR